MSRAHDPLLASSAGSHPDHLLGQPPIPWGIFSLLAGREAWWLQVSPRSRARTAPPLHHVPAAQPWGSPWTSSRLSPLLCEAERVSLFLGRMPGPRTVGVEENDCVQEEASKPQRSLLPSTLCQAPRPHVPAIGSASGETGKKQVPDLGRQWLLRRRRPTGDYDVGPKGKAGDPIVRPGADGTERQPPTWGRSETGGDAELGSRAQAAPTKAQSGRRR